MKLGTIAIAAAAAVVLSAGAATATYLAVDGDEAVEVGQCSGATYSLETEIDDGLREISFELQADAPEQTWQVQIAHGDEVLLEGTRETDEDAEIDVDVHAPRDLSGEVVVTATPESGGEPCTASIQVG